MPTTLTFEEHGEAIGNASTVLRANAGAVPLDTPVPTCPGWSVRDLVAHQGMVHRFATAVVEGARPQDVAADPFLQEAAAAPDLLDWFDAGATALLQALSTAPPDRALWFPLPDAPASREAWARRQAHETTIHAVDAMAARLGRPPTAREVWFGDRLALDGIDELLLGFVPHDRSRVRYAMPVTLRVAPTGTDRCWTVTLSPDAAPAVSHEAAPGDPGGAGDTGSGADVTVSGSPVEVHLGLWNRGGALDASGDGAVLAAWRAGLRITG